MVGFESRVGVTILTQSITNSQVCDSKADVCYEFDELRLCSFSLSELAMVSLLQMPCRLRESRQFWTSRIMCAMEQALLYLSLHI